MPPVRLHKLLADAGVASRRAAERLIVAGRVRVNGVAVTELGAHADPERDQIEVDGRPLPRAEPKRYVLASQAPGVHHHPWRIRAGGRSFSISCRSSVSVSTRSGASISTPRGSSS